MGAANISVAAQALSPGEGIILAIDAVTFLSQDNLEVAQNIAEDNALELAGVWSTGLYGVLALIGNRFWSRTSAPS